jgi:GDP-L-fucose synthase
MNNFSPSKEQNEKGEIFLNLGVGDDLTVKELALLVKNAVGFDGKIVLDTKKPDGIDQKVLNVSKIHTLGWRHKIELEEGVKMTYEWYKTSLNGAV